MQAARCKLVALTLELGGRWGTEANTFMKLLARLGASLPGRKKRNTVTLVGYSRSRTARLEVLAWEGCHKWRLGCELSSLNLGRSEGRLDMGIMRTQHFVGS